MEDLTVKYAKNRLALRDIKTKINKMHYGPEQNHYNELLMKSMAEYRNMYLDEIGMPMEWSWVKCLEEYEVFDGDEMELAKLFDKKKSLNYVAGNIKRAIYNEGMRRIKLDEYWRNYK